MRCRWPRRWARAARASRRWCVTNGAGGVRRAGRGGDRLGRERDAHGRRPGDGRTSAAAWAWPSACTARASPAWTWARPASRSTTTAVQPAGRRHRPGHRLRHGAGPDRGRDAGRAAGRDHHSTRRTPTSRPSTPAPMPAARPTSRGGAVMKAAEEVREQILARARPRCSRSDDPTRCGWKTSASLRRTAASVTLEQVALHSLHQDEQHQIMATASHMSLCLAAALRRAVCRGRGGHARPAR